MANLRYVPRSILTVLVGLVSTLIASALVIPLGHLRPTSPAIERVARAWSRAWLWAAGVELIVEGSKNIDPGRSYVVVANHLSDLDIMACFLAVPLPIRFLAKKELFRIPILSTAMRSIGIVEVDRQAHTAVHDQINAQTRQLVEAGRSLIIYPEGTRSRQGGLAPFKKGAFTIAVSSGLPVLPVAIQGSYEAWPPESLLVRGGRIQVAIDPAVETKAMTQLDTNGLRDQVHETIAARLESLAQS